MHRVRLMDGESGMWFQEGEYQPELHTLPWPVLPAAQEAQVVGEAAGSFATADAVEGGPPVFWRLAGMPSQGPWASHLIF